MVSTKSSTVVLAWVDHVLIMVSSVKIVEDPMWDEMLELLGPAAEKAGGFEAALVYSAGAAANASQRRRLADRMKALNMKSHHICLLSNSAFARATVPALARLLRSGTMVAAFKTTDWKQGLFWLKRHYGFDQPVAEDTFCQACAKAGVPLAAIGL